MIKLTVVEDPDVLDRLTLDDQVLDLFHKDQLAQVLRDKADLRPLQEAHRLEWLYRAGLRHKLEAQAAKVTAKPVEAPVVPSTVTKPSGRVFGQVRTCRDCGVALVPSGKRGKPAVRCPECRDGKVQTVAATKTTVNVCKTCTAEFPKTGKRGRQPSLCVSCKASEVLDTAVKTVPAKDKPKNVCKDCHKKFPNTGKRGRQPVKCPKCKAKEVAA